jgi:hypothetical protein
MDLLKQISERIYHLKSGENVTISAQNLLISRTDFQSLLIYLEQESKKGGFSIQENPKQKNKFENTSLTINKI